MKIKSAVVVVIFLNIFCAARSQAVAYSDPAQAYNKLLLDKNAGSYMRVGTFKVVGTPYLFGEKQTGSVYAKEGEALHVPVSYNTYTQQLEIYTAGNDKPIIKEISVIDSFRLEPSAQSGYTTALFFVNAAHAGFTEKAAFQVVTTGARYSLYKRYKTQLGYVSANYIQSDLRQFDLEYEYYFSDNVHKTVKKIKPSAGAVKKEFKGMDLSAVTDDAAFDANPENALLRVFSVLNQ